MNMEPDEPETSSRRPSIALAIRNGKYPVDRSTWAAAYAKQSRSDFAVYETFTSAEAVQQCPPLAQIEQCHSLHYLQTACEKIAKGYRFRDTPTPIESLLTSHVAFSKFIEGFLKTAVVKTRYKNKEDVLRNVSRVARLLAREIELVAPALGSETQPANAEYPWADAMQIITPCDYSFPNVNILREPVGRSFLKIIRLAIANFDQAEKG